MSWTTFAAPFTTQEENKRAGELLIRNHTPKLPQSSLVMQAKQKCVRAKTLLG